MAAPGTQKAIEGERAERIVEAMRLSVARRGVAGSTFDHVAREAQVSRGLLHYYFGTKERLLAEVARREAAVRVAVLRERLAHAANADELIEVLLSSLRATIRDDPEFVTVMFELFALARRHPEIAAEVEVLLAGMRGEVAGVLADLDATGAINLLAPADVVADAIFAIGDGAALRVLAEPSRDAAPLLAILGSVARSLLDSPPTAR